MDSKSFYTHHGAWGSYSSFVMGLIGKGGGFVLSDVMPPKNNIYIGYMVEGKNPVLMPFVTEYRMGLSPDAYDTETDIDSASWRSENTVPVPEDKIQREILWSTEIWKIPDMTFKIITPFDKIPDPAGIDGETAKFILAPLVFVELEFDNSANNKTMTGFFGLQGIKRTLSDVSAGALVGGARGTKYGFAVKASDDVSEVLAWDSTEAAWTADKQVQRLGNEGGIAFNVAAGTKKKFHVALGTYLDGYVTSGIRSRLYYTKYFSSLEDVLAFGIKNMDRYLETAEARDKELAGAPLNDDKKFIIAHATRSYMANTELLLNADGERIFIVNEGEYQMMNTLDLTIDQAFWEMWYSPWTVENELEVALKHYSYYDKVKDTSGNVSDGGLSFCHDIGVADMFSPKEYSSYELPELSGCFSYMTHEQLLNWIITAAMYIFVGKNNNWAESKIKIFGDLLHSLMKRDGNDDGIMDRDSTRCGGGSEITTYDSLDESLGQARNNLYLGVKTWAAYVCLEKIFQMLNENEKMATAAEKAGKCAATIISKYDEAEGFIPAVFENDNISKIIPAVEGLIYPWIIEDRDAVSEDGRFGPFIRCLKKHLNNVLKKGICIDAVSGGWKLSSTSYNTWCSKIFINQFIAREILQISSNDWDRWDKVHASWQTDACKSWAVTDQVRSDTGKDLGSRLYPRLVTSFLWLKRM